MSDSSFKPAGLLLTYVRECENGALFAPLGLGYDLEPGATPLEEDMHFLALVAGALTGEYGEDARADKIAPVSGVDVALREMFSCATAEDQHALSVANELIGQYQGTPPVAMVGRSVTIHSSRDEIEALGAAALRREEMIDRLCKNHGVTRLEAEAMMVGALAGQLDKMPLAEYIGGEPMARAGSTLPEKLGAPQRNKRRDAWIRKQRSKGLTCPKIQELLLQICEEKGWDPVSSPQRIHQICNQAPKPKIKSNPNDT